jgi:hypothetical protein
MYELTEQALQLLIKKFVEEIKKQIATKQFPYAPGYNGGGTQRGVGDKIATGQLYDSIQGSVTNTPDGPVALLEYADYFKYVNEGRRPNVKRVPIKELLEWIKIRGVRFRNERGRFRRGTRENMAFAIQKNIYKYGIKPANIYDKGLDGIEDYFVNFPNNLPPDLRAAGQHLFEAMAEDINVFVDQTITNELESIKTSEFVKIVS